MCDKAFNFAKNLKYDGYQRGFASIVHKCFDKKFVSLGEKSASRGTSKNEIMSSKELP